MNKEYLLKQIKKRIYKNVVTNETFPMKYYERFNDGVMEIYELILNYNPKNLNKEYIDQIGKL